MSRASAHGGILPLLLGAFSAMNDQSKEREALEGQSRWFHFSIESGDYFKAAHQRKLPSVSAQQLHSNDWMYS